VSSKGFIKTLLFYFFLLYNIFFLFCPSVTYHDNVKLCNVNEIIVLLELAGFLLNYNLAHL